MARTGRPPLDVMGQVFGQMTALRRGWPSDSGLTRWWCECSCKRVCVLVWLVSLQKYDTTRCMACRKEGDWSGSEAAMVLKAGQVREVRILRKEGRSVNYLAVLYRVSRSTIQRAVGIRHSKHYKAIHDDVSGETQEA